MNYYTEIKSKLLNNEAYERVKDYSKERHRVLTYFEIGRLLYQAGKHYGESIIKNYSEKLTKELGGKYNERTLQRMRQFYMVFSNPKWSTISVFSNTSLATVFNSQNPENKGVFNTNRQNIYTLATLLTWSHYIELLALKNDNEIKYYFDISIQQKLTRNELRKELKQKNTNDCL